MSSSPQLPVTSYLATIQQRRACLASGIGLLMFGLVGFIPTCVASAMATTAIAAILATIFAIITGITGLVIANQTTPTISQMSNAQVASSEPKVQVQRSIQIYSWMMGGVLMFAVGSLVHGIVILAAPYPRNGTMTGAVSLFVGVSFTLLGSIQICILRAALRNSNQANSQYIVPLAGSNTPIVVGGYHPNSTGFMHNQFAVPVMNPGSTSYLSYPNQNEISQMVNSGFPQQVQQRPDAPPTYQEIVASNRLNDDLNKQKF